MGAARGDSSSAPPAHRSAVHTAVNGFMLGLSLTFMRFRFLSEPSEVAKNRFRKLHRRASICLREFGIEAEIPPGQEAYLDRAHSIIVDLIEQTRARSNMLGAFYFIGGACAHLALGIEGTDRRALSDGISKRFAHAKLSPDLLRAFESRIVPFGSEVSASVPLSPCIEFLSGIVHQIPENIAIRTAFIAMPFGEDGETRYESLYAPVCRELGLTPVRAWGGISDEVYVHLLYQVIRRSDVMVADISGANPNVLHEVGLAQGMAKPVWLLEQEKTARVLDTRPSNLSGLPVFTYAPFHSGWVEDVVQRVAEASLDEQRDPTAWHRRSGGLIHPHSI